ncbi:MAG: LPS export ABC transporter periplasmic protein LptC [Methylococcales bacterium]|nr:LPS export ABC transporter periplasmic protein LptC [Methylococcales bacterium]
MIQPTPKLYFIVAILALLSWGLVRWNEEGDVAVKIAENSPDFFSTGYYKEQMNNEGLPENELLAETMQHYKFDGSTHLQKPVMTLYDSAGNAPWKIRADNGLMAADGENLQLIGQTSIHRDASKMNAELTINTYDLHVNLANNYAETAAWAEIISPPNVTSGTGMETIFVSPINLKLLSKVKGRYELK